MQLRDYQEEGLQALWDYFCTKKGDPVVAWPTGSGKSIIPAVFITRTLYDYPRERFQVLTHVKELVDQNYQKLIKFWQNAPVGINSAGLKRRDISQQIIYGNIQSCYKHPEYFGWIDVLFIDEAHLVNQDDASMYLGYIKKLREVNPNMRVVGLSATPYRMGQGYITDGGLFTEIAHDLTSLENFNKLLRDGYLCELVAPSELAVSLDISNVKIQGGEFNQKQLQHEVDKAEITWKALQEICYYGQSRRSWLIFATGVEHAEHIAAMLGQLGIDCAPVHSRQSEFGRDEAYNDAAIKAFKEYRLRSIVNYGKLTTGFDHDGIDLIGMFRPTLSVPLWVQMLGRGTRPEQTPGYFLADNSEDRLNAIRLSNKRNCLVLDYARNTRRLGPINDPVIPRKKGEKGGEVPIKICPSCGNYNHVKNVTCTSCGHEFEFKVKITEQAGTDELLRQTEAPIVEMLDVSYAIYNEHKKAGKPSSLKATYFSGMKGYSEWVFFENRGMARHKAHEWWRQRSLSDPPDTVQEVINMKSELRMPKRIRVHTNRMVNGKNFPEILSVEF